MTIVLIVLVIMFLLKLNFKVKKGNSEPSKLYVFLVNDSQSILHAKVTMHGIYLFSLLNFNYNTARFIRSYVASKLDLCSGYLAQCVHHVI